MRPLCVFVLANVLLGLSTFGYPFRDLAEAASNSESTKVNVGSTLYIPHFGSAPPPQGYEQKYCKPDPNYCRTRMSTSNNKPFATIKDVVEKINAEINDDIKSRTAKDKYLASEEVAMNKQRQLEAKHGIAPDSLLLAEVQDDRGEAKLVLLVSVLDGDIVLDDNSNDVLHWSKTKYKFIKRQSSGNRGKWLILKDAVTSLTSPKPIAIDLAKKWVGYKLTEDLNLPIKEQILNSTLRISHPSGAHSLKKDFRILETDKQKKVTSVSKLDSDLKALQIETCRRQGLKKCPVTKITANSTAFVQGGNQIHACRHSFHNWLAIASEVNGVELKQLLTPVVMRNHKGEVVYNSAYSDTKLSISFLNENIKFNTVIRYTDLVDDRSRYYDMSDYILFSTETNLFEPIDFRKATGVSASDLLYISGYAGKTNHYGGIKKGDAPGGKLVTSSGSLKTEYLTHYSITNISYDGNSGGPVVNENGELVGVLCIGDFEGSNPIKIDKYALKYAWEKYVDWFN